MSHQRLSRADRDALLASVDWRNELIHEYEPEASNDVFYATLKESLVAYRPTRRLSIRRLPDVREVSDSFEWSDEVLSRYVFGRRRLLRAGLLHHARLIAS